MKTGKERRGARGEALRALAGLASALVTAALVYAGLCFLTDAGARLDLTAERLTRLSEGSQQALDALEEPVRFTLVFASGTQNALRTRLETLAESYARSGKVTVETVDPIAEPERVAAYRASGETLAEGSVIVSDESGERFEVVPARDMLEYAQTASGGYRLTGIAAERLLTAALGRVSGAEETRVFFLTGHREAASADCASLTARLRAENYAVADFSLQSGEALSPGDVLLILSPTLDLTAAEADELNGWLDRGGGLLFACDASVDMGTLPRFSQLAERFSLAFEPGIVVEGENEANRWVSSPVYLMPRVAADGALAGFDADGRVILPGSRAVSGPQMPLSGYDYEALLTTSARATVRDASGGAPGERALAVSVSHETEEGALRAVLMGSLYALVDNSLLGSTANLEWSAALVGFLAARDGGTSVPVRDVGDTSMAIPSAAEAFAILSVCLCLPALAALAGAAVIVRRRRR